MKLGLLLVTIVLCYLNPMANSKASAFSGSWICYGTPLSNPLGRRACGQGWDEASARQSCGFDLVNISCQQSF